jgi:putative ABC transport system permease protein
MLALIGGDAGALATIIYASTKGWAVVIPALAWAAGWAP